MGLLLEEGPIERRAIDTLCSLAESDVRDASAADGSASRALAPVLYTLWQRFLRFDPEDPRWPNRDRFVLCEARAAALLHALRRVAGEKDVGEQHTPAQEGLATSARMAITARERAARFDRPGFPLFDYDVYALFGDGSGRETELPEAASLAAEQGLSNLCWICDETGASPAAGQAPAAGIAGRFRACGWNVVQVADAGDTEGLARAFGVFRASSNRPTLILVRGQAGAGPPGDPEPGVPPGVREHFRDGFGRRGKALRNAWFARLEEYRRVHRDLAGEIDRMGQPTPARKA